MPNILLSISYKSGNNLKDVVSVKDVITIARQYISDWEALAVHLDFTLPEINQIRDSFPPDVEKQARRCLQKWIRAKGSAATYQALIIAAEKANNRLLADNIIRAM